MIEKLSYLFFGGLTTLVNYAVYFAANALIKGERAYLISNGIAWIAAVSFAFVTNKKYVFKSKTAGAAELLREAGSFAAARLASLAIDYGWMLAAVELLRMDDKIAKIFSNVFVVIINYFFSKLFIFNKGGRSEREGERTDDG